MKMKKIFCLAVMFVVAGSVCALGSVPVDEEHFPDENFRDYVSSNFDKDRDGTLS